MYKVHLLIILASKGLAVYRERKKKKGKTSNKVGLLFVSFFAIARQCFEMGGVIQGGMLPQLEDDHGLILKCSK